MPKIDKSLLAGLAADSSARGRKKLIEAVSNMFVSDAQDLQSSERGLAYDILRMTIHDIDKSVRCKIAEQLSELTDVPDQLLGILTNDDIEIAFPILAYSPILCDEDLIRIIRTKTSRHQQAVTLRDNLSDVVSEELVATGDLAVIRRLLANTSANISYDSMEKITERSRHEDSLQELLLSRDDLPVSLAERMFPWVKVVLRQYILDNFKVDTEALDEVLVDIVFEDVCKIKEQEVGGGATNATARAGRKTGLHGQNNVADQLLTSLANKRTLDFLTLFEKNFGLPQPIILRAISDKGCEGLGVAVKSAKLGKAIFLGILSHLRLSKIDGDTNLRSDIAQCMKFYDSVDDTVVSEIVAAWKGNQDFVFSMSKLNLT